jgi:hypothetical protein
MSRDIGARCCETWLTAVASGSWLRQRRVVLLTAANSRLIHFGGDAGCASGRDEPATASRRPRRHLAAAATPPAIPRPRNEPPTQGPPPRMPPPAAPPPRGRQPPAYGSQPPPGGHPPIPTHPRSDRTCRGGSSSASSSSSFSADAGCFRGSTRPRGPTGEPVESAAERQRCGDPAGRRRGGHRSSATRPAPSAAVQMCAAAARCG